MYGAAGWMICVPSEANMIDSREGANITHFVAIAGKNIKNTEEYNDGAII